MSEMSILTSLVLEHIVEELDKQMPGTGQLIADRLFQEVEQNADLNEEERKELHEIACSYEPVGSIEVPRRH